MLVPVTTRRFEKDMKRISKRGKDVRKLKTVVALLSEQSDLPPQNRDHVLTGNWMGYRECHIEPDWLLIYHIDQAAGELWLDRTGSHSDLFS